MSLAVLLVFAIVINVGPPDGAALDTAGPDVSMGEVVSWLMSGLMGAVGWAAPRGPGHPHGPGELSGTAAGRKHVVGAGATRAGRGTGRAPAKGRGELSAAHPMARTIKTGRSSGSRRGFDRATSIAVPSQSTANSTYYKNADGSFSRVLSTGPVNYRNGSKGWSRIETGVNKSTDGRWREQANSLQVQFAPYADDNRLASVAVDAQHTVSQHLLGAAHVAGIGTTSTVSYPQALPGVDVHLQATATGDKESMILRTADAAPSWDFALDLHGLSAVLTADDAVVLRNAAGAELLNIPPGYAWDSAPAPPGGARTVPVKYQLDGSTLHVSLDPAWLHDPTRVFPVTVDPTTNAGAYSTYVEQNSAPADHSGETVMKVGTADSGAHTDRSFLSFPDLGIHDSNVSEAFRVTAVDVG